MADVRITLLGPLSVEIGGDAVSLGGHKQQALLAFLVLNSPNEMSADRCIDAVWGDQATPGSVHSLQTYVSNLRRLLEPHHEKGEPWTVIESTPTGYRFAGHSQASDLRHFEELVDQAADAPPEQAVEFLADALELWGERPLGDLGDEPWAHAFTARLTEMHLDALAGFFDARLELGEHDAVVGDVEALVGSHPYDERLWGQLMLALYRSGRQADALRSYQRLRSTLAEELGIEPSPDVRKLEQQILDQDPALDPTNRTPNNIPAATTSLIGRDADIVEVVRLLGISRLVTLAGSGGVGKTRLGHAVATSALASYPDGVWFVDLAPLADPDLVLPTIAAAIGVEPPALRPLPDALADAIGGKQMLFVVDNCEHLVDAAASATTTLVRLTSSVDVLATSREVLRIPGEVVWRVPSLETPNPGVADLTQLAANASVALFMERASAVDSTYTLTERNGSAVGSLCRHVDGIPLAIELAASRIETLTAEDLDRRLGETMDVLSGGTREVLARHRTLRAAIEWSYGLLSPQARAFLDSVGVLAGSFTAEAAAAITGASEPESTDLIEELIAKSMLTPLHGSPRRFRTLEAIRQFALEHLFEQGQLDSVRDAHLEWITTLCKRETPKLNTGEQLEALAEIRTDIDDIRAALRWSLDSGRPELGLAIAAPLGRYWYLGSMHQEGAAWFDELFAAKPDMSDLAMGRALTAASITFVRIGRTDDAAAHAREALRLLEPLGEPQALGWAQYYLGVSSVVGDYENIDEVEALWSAAKASFVEAGYPPGVALASLLLAAASLVRDPLAATTEIEALLGQSEEAGVANMIAHCVEFLAKARRDAGRLDEVGALLERSIELHAETGNWACLTHCIEGGVASYLMTLGRDEDAARIVGGTDTMRLNLATVEAPYERFITDFYPWVQAIDEQPLLVAAREEGRAWSRDELIERALGYAREEQRAHSVI